MQLSSSSTPKMKKLNESKEAAVQPEFSGLKRKIEPKFSNRKKKINENCNENPMASSSKMCHQCKRDDRGQVIRCLKCKRHRYCVPCITKWYPMMSEKDFELACPFCKGNCNCIKCLRSKGPLLAELRWKFKIMRSADNISETAKHLLKTIMPFMRQIHEEQIREKMWEAKIQGISSLQLKVEEAMYHLDEHV